jgi:ribosome recycling factor
MTKDDILLETEMAMEKSVDFMVHEFAAVRTGKASPTLVENVDVHAYGWYNHSTPEQSATSRRHLTNRASV